MDIELSLKSSKIFEYPPKDMESESEPNLKMRYMYVLSYILTQIPSPILMLEFTLHA